MEFESNNISEDNNNNHGWQKVTYAKKNRKNQPKQQVPQPKALPNGSVVAGNDNVFTAIEKKSEERRKVIEAQRLSIYDPAPPPVKSSRKKNYSDYEDSDEEVANGVAGNDDVEEKKKKPKKVKKPKVTIAEAAEKIDVDDLASFLLEVTTSFEAQQDIQLMRFADYFGRAFSSVTASQFPWVKLLRESPDAQFILTISCKIDDAGSHEINGVRRRDVLNCFGAAISMELVASSSPISSPFIEAANAADLIQRRQRSDFQSSIKMTLYKAIKANPELISPLLTLALNDSMTYDKPTKTGGPNGSIRFRLRDQKTKDFLLLYQWWKKQKKEIDSYSKGGPISYSDLIQLAGLDEDESTLHITELPVRRWTQEYKEFLEVASTAGKDKKPFIEGMVLSEAKKIIDSCMAAKG
ncbi:hypothetical protein Lser_V15G29906 [Lactuca serriola]